MTDPESVRYRQVVVFATRRSRREREQLKDNEIVARRAQFASTGGNYGQLAPLGDVGAQMCMFPRVVRSSWSVAAFLLMRLKTFFRALLLTAKPLESSFPSHPWSKGDR